MLFRVTYTQCHEVDHRVSAGSWAPPFRLRCVQDKATGIGNETASSPNSRGCGCTLTFSRDIPLVRGRTSGTVNNEHLNRSLRGFQSQPELLLQGGEQIRLRRL